jgi:excisionase family DNA binding protein
MAVHPPSRPASTGCRYTLAEAAALIGVSVETLRRYVKDGHLKAIRLPTGHYRFGYDHIAELLESRRLGDREAGQ